MDLPRFLLSAPASGSGKTMLTCGILQVLKNRGMHPVSFKCGPDYIDPMFHRTVLETPSRNLDTYFTDEETTRYLMMRGSTQADIAVVEGVMGYYDGLGAVSDRASAYDVARVTKTPTVLIVNCKGMSLSVAALVKGFLEFRPDSGIAGLILNRCSGMLYPRLKDMLEKAFPVRVLGYVPETDLLNLESRHLGLVMPEEIPQLKVKVMKLAELLEETLQIDDLLELAKKAVPLEGKAPSVPHVDGEPVIAVAKDEAFCFYYEDNLQLLKEAGAKIIEFSPMRDQRLPDCDGLLLGGGYPELFLPKLSGNEAMRREICTAVKNGLPTLAECGGFMYLMKTMEDMDGHSWPVAGVIPGKAWRTKRLQRFGYIELYPEKDQILGTEQGSIRGHEFHYFDTDCNGDAFRANKPLSDRGWDCMVERENTLLAGFPHLYYYSNPEMAVNFVRRCAGSRYRQCKENADGYDR